MKIFTGNSLDRPFKSEVAAELDIAVNSEEIDLDKVEKLLGQLPLPLLGIPRLDFSNEKLEKMGITI